MNGKDLRLVWRKTGFSNMIYIWNLDLNVAYSYFEKKNSIKKRGDESRSEKKKMQTFMSSRPCGTLLNILNILGGKNENSFSQLNQRRESLSSLKILWGNSLNYLLAFWLYFMVGWVAGCGGRTEGKGEPGQKWEKPGLTFSVSAWNILKAACLFEIAQSPATMDCCLRASLGHICIQKTSCWAAIMLQSHSGPGRSQVTSKC